MWLGHAEQDLRARKLGILRLLEAAPATADQVVLHCLVAACDPSDAVARLGDELLRKKYGNMQGTTCACAWMHMCTLTYVHAYAQLCPLPVPMSNRLIACPNDHAWLVFQMMFRVLPVLSAVLHNRLQLRYAMC